VLHVAHDADAASSTEARSLYSGGLRYSAAIEDALGQDDFQLKYGGWQVAAVLREGVPASSILPFLSVAMLITPIFVY